MPVVERGVGRGGGGEGCHPGGGGQGAEDGPHGGVGWSVRRQDGVACMGGDWLG